MHIGDWRVLIDQGRPAHGQMACDVELAREPIPTLRLFRWRAPAISLGFKQPLPAWWQPRAWKAAGLAHVERPTAGGMAFHGSDVSVSVIVPRTLDLPLRMLMGAVCENAVRLCRGYGAQAAPLLDMAGTQRITYCLTDLSSYAVVLGGRPSARPAQARDSLRTLPSEVEGRKVAGFALRRYPQTWLIQGSLLVQPLPRELAQAIPAEVRSQLHARAVSLAEASQRPVTEADVMEQWSRHWPAWWEETTSLRAQGSGLGVIAQSPQPPAQSHVVVGHV